MRPERFTWSKVLGWDAQPSRRDHDWRAHESRRRLLPLHREETIRSAIPAEEVTKIALRLRYLIEAAVPCELDADQITKPHSRVITKKVIEAARNAGGAQHRACVVFALLTVIRWFRYQARLELWDADLHNVRSIACEVVAKAIIEEEEDMAYLLHSVLLKRYSTVIDGEPTAPANVIEKGVDLHALRVIGSSGYQKCVAYLWKGWLVQDENDPANFVDYKARDDVNYSVHLNPDRMRTPINQNAAQLLFSLIYLALYTIAINTINPSGDLDIVEGLLYIFTLGFLFDEITKVWKAGYHILGFWNAFNTTMYSLLIVSLVMRFIAFAHPWDDSGRRELYNNLSYNFLAFSAPMFWARLLLYLDGYRFFGAMFVVLKVMMSESVIFFALLAVVVVGFLQAFIGMDYADDMAADDTIFILQAMANAVMQSPDFTGFERFSPPFGIILYYIFTFVVMVVLLNILIALYNSAYEDIYQNADEEFLALFSQKTMQFVRAPDENVFIAPFNLIEIFFLSLPFEWWMSKPAYEHLNNVIMSIIYAPLLLVSAYFETRSAKLIRANRVRGDVDEDTIEEWEQLSVDFEGEGWTKKVDEAKSCLEEEPAVVEVRKLETEVAKLKELLEGITKTLSEKAESTDLLS